MHGNVVLDENFCDLFGWNFSFIDNMIAFIAQEDCYHFFLFLRDFHNTYRAYVSFWQDFFNKYQEDVLYIKYKQNFKTFFNIELEHYETTCREFIYKTINNDKIIPHTETDNEIEIEPRIKIQSKQN